MMLLLIWFIFIGLNYSFFTCKFRAIFSFILLFGSFFLLIITICPWSIIFYLLPFNPEVILFMDNENFTLVSDTNSSLEIYTSNSNSTLHVDVPQPQINAVLYAPAEVTPVILNNLHLPPTGRGVQIARFLSYMPLGLTSSLALAVFSLDSSSLIFAVPGVILDISYYLSFSPTAKMMTYGSSVQANDILALPSFPPSDSPTNLFTAQVYNVGDSLLTSYEPLPSFNPSTPLANSELNFGEPQLYNSANPKNPHQRYGYIYRHLTASYNSFLVPTIFSAFVYNLLP